MEEFYRKSVNMRVRNYLLRILEKKSCWIVITVGIVFITNLPFLSIRHMLNTDEFPSLAVPAYYAGYDWSDFVSKLNFHGYGFTIIFTPLFRILSNSEHIYVAVLIGSLILRILIALIAFDICSKLFLLNYKISFMIAAICEVGTLSVDEGIPLSAMSELPSAFILLVATMFFWKGWKSYGAKRVSFFILTCFFMGYGYTIHSRSIIMWFSAFVTLLIYVFLYKEFDRKIVFYFLIFIGIIGLMAYIDSCIQNSVWRVTDGEQLANTVTATTGLKITGNIRKFASLELMKLSVYILGSLFGTLTIYTGGIIWFFTAVNISAIWVLRKRRGGENKLLVIFILFGLISFYGMNASIAISSTGSVQVNNLRVLTYIRYCKPFGYLLVLTALICLFKGICDKFFVSCFWLAGVCVSLFVLLSKTAEHLQTTRYALQYSVLNRIWYSAKEESVREYFMKMSLICLSITVLAIIFWHKNSKVQIGVIYIIFSLLVKVEMYEYSINRELRMSRITDGTEEMAKIDCLKNCDIYIGGTNRYAMYLYWALYQDNLLYQADKDSIDLEENAIYFTDSIKDSTSMKVNYIFVVDDNEYMFTSDRSIAQSICEAGYEQY